MSKELSIDEIFDIVGSKSNASKHLVRRVWSNLVELIISEMKLNGYITLKNFGKFEIKEINGHDEIITNEYGFKERVYVDDHYDINFTPSVNLISTIDGRKEHWSKDGRCNFNDETDALMIRQNGIDVREINPSYQNLANKTLKERIAIVARRKYNRVVTSAYRKEHIKNSGKYKIKCIDNGVVYNSIRSCAKDLGIIYQNLYRHYNQSDTDEFTYGGYEFIKIISQLESEE